MKHSKEDTSYFDLISSDNAVIRRIGVGAENVEVTLCESTRRNQSSASNKCCVTTVDPTNWERKVKPKGPE